MILWNYLLDDIQGCNVSSFQLYLCCSPGFHATVFFFTRIAHDQESFNTFICTALELVRFSYESKSQRVQCCTIYLRKKWIVEVVPTLKCFCMYHIWAAKCLDMLFLSGIVCLHNEEVTDFFSYLSGTENSSNRFTLLCFNQQSKCSPAPRATHPHNIVPYLPIQLSALE